MSAIQGPERYYWPFPQDIVADPVLRERKVASEPKIWIRLALLRVGPYVDDPNWGWVINQIEETEDWRTREAIARVLTHVLKVAPLQFFEPRFKYCRMEMAASPKSWRSALTKRFTGLIALGRCWKHWVRPLETWRWDPNDSRRAMFQLVRHLVVKWDVPDFMDGAWVSARRDAEDMRAWYLKIAAGASPYRTNPLGMTRRQTRFFMERDDFQFLPDYSAQKRLEAQLRSMGMPAAQARDMRGWPLSFERMDHPERGAFWHSVARWLVAHPDFPRNQIAHVCEYVEAWKYGARGAPSMQPGLSIKGRSPRKLLREMGRWRRARAKLGIMNRSFEPTGRSGLEGEDRAGVWRIREMLSARQIEAQGIFTSLQAPSMALRCFMLHSSLWSLVHEGRDGVSRTRLMIEVSPEGEIIDTHGRRRNRKPTTLERGMMEQWAGAEGLTFKI